MIVRHFLILVVVVVVGIGCSSSRNDCFRFNRSVVLSGFMEMISHIYGLTRFRFHSFQPTMMISSSSWNHKVRNQVAFFQKLFGVSKIQPEGGTWKDNDNEDEKDD